MEAKDRAVFYYVAVSGRSPFREWRSRIADGNTKAAIDARIARFRGGNFGKSDPIGESAWESKIDFGPGWRIYYGRDGDDIVVLLLGGDKSTQDADIKLAKEYWTDYKNRRQSRKKK
jgi:putative addiction module killer protein